MPCCYAAAGSDVTLLLVRPRGAVTLSSVSAGRTSGVIAVLMIAGQPACADALQDRLVSEAKLNPPERYVMTRKVIVERRFGKTSERIVQLEEFDPRKPSTERWTLSSRDGRAPTRKEVQQFRRERNRDPVPSYARIAVYLAAEAKPSTSPEGQITYRIPKLPKGSLSALGSDISDHVAGEATINTSGATPYVEKMRLTLMQPTRVKLIARIDHMEAISHYRLSENGLPILVSQQADLTGNLLFRGGSMSMSAEYTSYVPIAFSASGAAPADAPSEQRPSQTGQSAPLRTPGTR